MRDGSVLAAYVHPATEIQHSFHVSLMAVVAYDAAHRQRLFGETGPLMMRCGTGGLVDARNKIMSHFLDQSEAEWLWTIDTDMGFPANVVDLLVDAADPVDRPVVGALCFSMRQGDPDGYGGYVTYPAPTIYGWGEDRSGCAGFVVASDYPRNEVVRVNATGAACMIVHRTAAEKVRAGHGDCWYDPVRYPDGRWLGEDLSFCWRLGREQIPVYVDTRVKTTHAKTVWLGERDWLAHRALTEAAARAAAAVEGGAGGD